VKARHHPVASKKQLSPSASSLGCSGRILGLASVVDLLEIETLRQRQILLAGAIEMYELSQERAREHAVLADQARLPIEWDAQKRLLSD